MRKNICVLGVILIFVLTVHSCCITQLDRRSAEEIAETPIYYSEILSFAPDRFNTGCDERLLRTMTDSGGYGEASDSQRNFYFDVRENDITINAYKNKQAADEVVVRNLNFTKKLMPTNSDAIYTSCKTVIFENCKFKNVQHNSQRLKLVFKHCTFNGNVSNGNIELYDCRIEKTLSDAMNPLVNFTAKNVYIRNLIHTTSTTGAHVDGVQIFGNKNITADNISITNTRFSLPNLQYDGAKTYINAAILMQLEFGNAENVIFKDIILDCGGPWAPCRSSKPLLLEDGTQLYEKNIKFINMKVSNHYNKCFFGDYYSDDIIEENITFPGLLYVTSVMHGEDGNTYVIATNNTKEDKKLTVKSGKKIWSFAIPMQPAPIDVYKKEEFASLRYYDLPFDVICPISEILQSGSCYDGDELIQQFEF